eukprot:414640-Rhodomonas_salina.1
MASWMRSWSSSLKVSIPEKKSRWSPPLWYSSDAFRCGSMSSSMGLSLIKRTECNLEADPAATEQSHKALPRLPELCQVARRRVWIQGRRGHWAQMGDRKTCEIKCNT